VQGIAFAFSLRLLGKTQALPVVLREELAENQ
jgi:hypothetical protein